jgi:hypothetical protein
VYIINGQHPERLAELIEKGRAEGTRVVRGKKGVGFPTPLAV